MINLRSLFAFALIAAALAVAHADPAPTPTTVTIPVSSPAFVFSPGNWTGDKGRGGDQFRQTWYSGAYFRVTWTGNAKHIRLLIDTSGYGDAVKVKPHIAYCMDGHWGADVECKDAIDIPGSPYTDAHWLAVYLQNSQQADRWGAVGASGLNILKVTGLELDSDAKLLSNKPASQWILEVGDSITEGSGTTGNLDDYSYFIGQAMQTVGYEYCVSACGWSGWLQYGDRPKDVPPYYFVAGSANGVGGKYDTLQSRWDKIDGNGHSLLDAKGHISGYGDLGQEPSMILINYGTNDAFWGSNVSDLQASIYQALETLRAAAPAAKIYVIVPFEQFSADSIKGAVKRYQTVHDHDKAVRLIDLGTTPATMLRGEGFYGAVHPNMRGHAAFAAQLLVSILGK